MFFNSCGKINLAFILEILFVEQHRFSNIELYLLIQGFHHIILFSNECYLHNCHFEIVMCQIFLFLQAKQRKHKIIIRDKNVNVTNFYNIKIIMYLISLEVNGGKKKMEGSIELLISSIYIEYVLRYYVDILRKKDYN